MPSTPYWVPNRDRIQQLGYDPSYDYRDDTGANDEGWDDIWEDG